MFLVPLQGYHIVIADVSLTVHCSYYEAPKFVVAEPGDVPPGDNFVGWKELPV